MVYSSYKKGNSYKLLIIWCCHVWKIWLILTVKADKELIKIVIVDHLGRKIPTVKEYYCTME